MHWSRAYAGHKPIEIRLKYTDGSYKWGPIPEPAVFNADPENYRIAPPKPLECWVTYYSGRKPDPFGFAWAKPPVSCDIGAEIRHFREVVPDDHETGT